MFAGNDDRRVLACKRSASSSGFAADATLLTLAPTGVGHAQLSTVRTVTTNADSGAETRFRSSENLVICVTARVSPCVRVTHGVTRAVDIVGLAKSQRCALDAVCDAVDFSSGQQPEE